jgi:hypothetical protein
MSEKAISIGHYFVASGVYTVFGGVSLPVTGSPVFQNYVTFSHKDHLDSSPLACGDCHQRATSEGEGPRLDFELIRYSKERIAGFKAPKRIIWVDGPLPRTPTGKVTKYMLVEKYSKE